MKLQNSKRLNKTLQLKGNDKFKRGNITLN